MYKKIPSSKLVGSALAVLASLGVGHGQTTWDNGAAPDINWSTSTNWSTDASPAGTAVVFGNLGASGSSTTVTNVVDTSFSAGNALSSLTFSNTGASVWQVTQVSSGQTLAVNGPFVVGGYTSGSNATQAAFAGSGTLAVNAASSTFSVSNAGSTSGRAILDLSALGAFTAQVNAFDLGGGTTGFGTLYLSDNSTITANTFTTGGSGSSYGAGVSNRIFLGNSTTLNSGTVSLGGNRTYGTVKFRAAGDGAANNTTVTGGSLKIRGTDGVGAATLMTVGAWTGAFPGGSSGASSVDLTGGTVDAKVTTLKVGTNSTSGGNGGRAGTATLTIDGSTSVFEVSGTATVGELTGNGSNSGTLNGVLNVKGGASFTAGAMTLANQTSGGLTTTGTLNVSGNNTSVSITNNLTMGVRSGSAAVAAGVNVSAGTLLIGGNMVEGAGAANIDSTVNLSGGVLNMTQGVIAVDNFVFTGSGALRNVAAFSAAGTGGLAMSGNTTLGFDNISSINGSALLLTGLFSLTGSQDLSLSLANGFDPGAGSILLVDNDGSGDEITGTFGSVNGVVGGTFTLTNDQGSFQYQLSYAGGDGNDLVAVAVPEPSVCALLGLSLAAVLRRRRSVR